MGGGCLGASGDMEGCPHMHAHACTHTHAHVYTYRNCEMAADMEVSMFSMPNMHVHACMHACTCMHGTPPTYPYPPPPPIPFEDLKSVKNSPPMGGCMDWWVDKWLGGLMGGVRSNNKNFKNVD